MFRLCSNGDQGLISLFHQCILPLPFPSKRTMGDNYVEEVPNTLFASAFGLDRRGEELPRPRAIRCFQGAMKSQRHNTFWEVFRTIVMLMVSRFRPCFQRKYPLVELPADVPTIETQEGTPFKRFLENLDVGMFTTPRAVEDMYQDHLQSHSLDPTFKLQTREQFKQQLFEFFGTDVNGDLRRRCSICAKPREFLVYPRLCHFLGGVLTDHLQRTRPRSIWRAPPARPSGSQCFLLKVRPFSPLLFPSLRHLTPHPPRSGNASSLVESRTGRIAASPSRTSPSRMPQ